MKENVQPITEDHFEVGDYAIHGFGHFGKITQIKTQDLPSGIKATLFCVYDKGLNDGKGCCEVWFAENEMRPIPITEERLKRNGFVDATPKGELRWRRYAWYGSKGAPSVTVELCGYIGDTPNYLIDVNNGKAMSGNTGRYIHNLQQAIRKAKIVKNLIV